MGGEQGAGGNGPTVHGVGILGAGPGVSALHLPTLARLPELFRVVAIADGGSGRSAELAEREGASALSDAAELVRHPGVEVVAICSPPDLHAEHIDAALDAGVRGILCEKPLATSGADARRVIERARAAGVALVVGTNHGHDAAWPVATRALTDLAGELTGIGVTMALPPNGRYHALVTEYERAASAPPRGAPDWSDPRIAAGVVRQLLLGLAIHDLPAIRELLPDFEGVDFARALAPIGYAVGFRSSGVPVQLSAVMLGDGHDALWRLSIATTRGTVDVEYPPAFVHAGSGLVRVRDAEGRRVDSAVRSEDGYVREWRELDAQLQGTRGTDYAAVLDDALFAVALADAAAASLAGALP